MQTTATDDATIAMLLEEHLIDEVLVQEVANELSELIENDGPSDLILDLSLVTIVGSSMLGKLVTLHKKVKSAGGSLRLCGISPQLYEVFAITKLNKLLVMCDSQQQALESIRTSANA